MSIREVFDSTSKINYNTITMHLPTNTLLQFGKYKIENKNTMDGLKLLLEDGSWILIRKSGTEPLLRIYFESDKEEKITELKSLVKQLC